MIKSKIDANVESIDDLEYLNHFVSTTSKNYLLNKMYENCISSFEQFEVLRKNKNRTEQEDDNVNVIIGSIYGIIEHIEKEILS